GEPLGTEAEPGPSLSDGVRGPSHPPGGCSVTRPPSCRVTRPRAWSQPSILNRFASLLAGVDAERQSQLRRLESPAFGCGPSPSSAGVSHHFYPLRRLVIRNPLEQGHGMQSNPLCMKDLWPSASQFWKIIPDLKTVNNPDPDSFRPKNQRKRAQNPQ